MRSTSCGANPSLAALALSTMGMMTRKPAMISFEACEQQDCGQEHGPAQRPSFPQVQIGRDIRARLVWP